MPWFTDSHIQSIPALAEVDRELIPEVVADAGTLYQHVEAVPGIEDSELRSWAEFAGIPPERFNRAAAFLGQTGRAVRSEGLVVRAEAQEPSLADLVVGDSIPSKHLTKDELTTIAERLKLDVAKSATKAEIAEAISRA